MHTSIGTQDTLIGDARDHGARERLDMADRYDRWITLKARMDAAWAEVVDARDARKAGAK